MQIEAQLSPLDEYFQRLSALLAPTPILRRNQIVKAVRSTVRELEESATLPRLYTYEQLEAYLGSPDQVVAIAEADLTVIKAGNGFQVIQAADSMANGDSTWGKAAARVRIEDAELLRKYGDLMGWGENTPPAPVKPDYIDTKLESLVKSSRARHGLFTYFLPIAFGISSIATALFVPLGFFLGMFGLAVTIYLWRKHVRPVWPRVFCTLAALFAIVCTLMATLRLLGYGS